MGLVVLEGFSRLRDSGILGSGAGKAQELLLAQCQHVPVSFLQLLGNRESWNGLKGIFVCLTPRIEQEKPHPGIPRLITPVGLGVGNGFPAQPRSGDIPEVTLAPWLLPGGTTGT